MPDIFISYKKEEKPVAERFAQRLTEAGYDVWWDNALLAGQRFADEIQTILDGSRAAIILWSRLAISSTWVKDEADAARELGKAIPVLIDGVARNDLPIPFRQLHFIDLSNWDGNPQDERFVHLLKAVREKLGAATGPALTRPEAEAKLAGSVTEVEIWAAIAGAQNQSAEEYRDYLSRFGENARFADIARMRMRRIGQEESRRRRGTAWPMFVAAFVVICAAVGLGVTLLSPTSLAHVEAWLNGLSVSQADRDAGSRCMAWVTSSNVDTVTLLPAIQATTVADCTTAQQKFPAQPDFTGALALVRLAQGGDGANEAIALANKGIESGSALANYVLGLMYVDGLGLQRNQPRGAEYLKTAAAGGSAQAAASLCSLALANNGYLSFTADPTEVFGFCKLADAAGDAMGQLDMGFVYQNALFGVPVNLQMAAQLYSKAADQGYLHAKTRLGLLYLLGLGLDKNPVMAMQLFQQAADAGDPAGQRLLGVSYELGQGVDEDVPHAARLYDQAMQHGDIIAFLLLGLTPQAPVDSATYLDIRALSNDPSTSVAQRLNGEAFLPGLVQQPNPTLAAAEFDGCAKAGNVICQFVAGVFYQNVGLGTPDLTKARAYYQQSAEGGEMHAQYNVAYMYEFGISGAKDLSAAADWYRKSAAQGSAVASQRLQTVLADLGTAAAQDAGRSGPDN